jgi:hypothetical protein
MGWLPAFALAFAVLIMGPCVLGIPLPGYPHMAVADALDLFTPVVLLPLYGRLLYEAHGVPSARVGAAFLVLAALWVEGQGIHLAANSLGHHVNDAAPEALRSLVYFYDEGLSHALWHSGVMGLSALCMWPGGRALAHDALGVPLACSVVYGFTYFCMVIEGATAVVGVPFAVGAALVALRSRASLARRPVPLFFAAGYAFASLLFLVWGVWWGGLPEFSEVGLI